MRGPAPPHPDYIGVVASLLGIIHAGCHQRHGPQKFVVIGQTHRSAPTVGAHLCVRPPVHFRSNDIMDRGGSEQVIFEGMTFTEQRHSEEMQRERIGNREISG